MSKSKVATRIERRGQCSGGYLIATVTLWLLVPSFAIGGSPADPRLHWSFRPFGHSSRSEVDFHGQSQTAIDGFIIRQLKSNHLCLSRAASKTELVRRVTFAMTGLQPSPVEYEVFTNDSREDAFDRLVDRLLSSPRYGERWGKYWLDVVGYSDSNGYFNADSDRPLAYQFRDYVIRSFNNDKPFDEFVREQLAGDEIAGVPAPAGGGEVQLPNDNASASVERIRELLIATHFLRNAQDGTSESDGNPDEQTIDRATALEGCLQITMNSLLGLTIQCARCHSHKFEPIQHQEYYQLQAVFYPAFPAFHADHWIKPKDRFAYLAAQPEWDAWRDNEARIDQRIAAIRREFTLWRKQVQPPGMLLYSADFDNSQAPLDNTWCNAVPGDDSPAGSPPVSIGSSVAPAAFIRDGLLVVLESGDTGDRWLATRQVFDWTPDRKGDWIQATFDLIDNKADPAGKPADRIAFCVALHDFNDNSAVQSGNILIDGNPAGGAAVHTDYPGSDSTSMGTVGAFEYKPGHNFGVRISNTGDDQFRLEHLVDSVPDGKHLMLKSIDLPDGAFGFEYCCGRSFIVDNVSVEGPTVERSAEAEEFSQQVVSRQDSLARDIKAASSQRTEKPGKLAFTSDLVRPVPNLFVLDRGNYKSPQDKVLPASLSIFEDSASQQPQFLLKNLPHTSGRRLAFADRLTASHSRGAALLARVMANRIWQNHFETGIVASTGNFGVSGSKPTHPELLEHLAMTLSESEWSVKSLHRQILFSSVFQQTSQPEKVRLASGQQHDPDNRLLWRFPIRRLDAEALRDAMLLAAGELEDSMYGPYTPTQRNPDGGVTVDEGHTQSRRRAIYLQQRRSQVESLLEVFDSPPIVTTCTQRNVSTVPLQSLALLNSDWVRKRAEALSKRIRSAATDDAQRIMSAFQMTISRPPTSSELSASSDFLSQQRGTYGLETEIRTWNDFCQMLLASNAFIYVE